MHHPQLTTAFTWFCIFLSGIPFSQGAGDLNELAWFVQVSDIHLSRFAEQQMPKFGDKEGDFGYLASDVLRYIVPGSLILTGDLVDGKTRLMRGSQDEAEWKKYRQVIENATAAGIAESTIVDLRGNHDVFDVPKRGVLPDYFAQYGAAGRRNGTARIQVLSVASPASLPSSTGCPAAVILGIDLTPSPGLRGPTDFFGRADEKLLRELDSILANLQSAHRRDGCRPVIVAAGHYPLTVVVHPDTARFDRPPVKTGVQGSGAHSGGDGTLRGVLAQHGVAAYLCGHLHGLFSQRQHMLHPGPSGGHLAEMETTAWKDDRRFRLLVADRGVLSFSELYLNTPTKVKPRPPPAEPIADDAEMRHRRGPTTRGYGIVSIEPTQRVNGHIVMIASPPDGRYAPLTPPADGRRRFEGVRALVFPVEGSAIDRVVLRWRCAGSETAEWHTAVMQRAVDGQPLFTAAPEGDTLACTQEDAGGSIMLIQVVVAEHGGKTSSSEERQVAVADAAGETGSRKHVMAEPSQPLPLAVPPLARFVLWADMGRFGTRLTYSLWLCHLLGMLLLPKMCPQGLASWLRGDAVHRPGKQHAAAARGIVQSALRLAAAPLLDMASMETLWLLQVIYAFYLAIGPWFAARFLSDAPVGLYFLSGVLLRVPQPGPLTSGDTITNHWRFIHMPDTLILCFYHWLFTLLPGTFWLAWVLSGWRRRGKIVDGVWHNPATRGGRPLPFTLFQAVVGMGLIYAHLVNLRRILDLYGPSSPLVSPGFGWTLPLAAGLLLGAWRQKGAAPVERAQKIEGNGDVGSSSEAAGERQEGCVSADIGREKTAGNGAAAGRVQLAANNKKLL